MRPAPITAAMLLAAMLVASPGAQAAEPERGRALYEARCGGCHASSVHGRERREATDFGQVRGWVRRWAANLGLAWTEAEVDDVAVHLNATYYRFRCPPDACKASVQRGHAAPRLALDGRAR